MVQCSQDWLENAQLAGYKFRSYRSPVCSYFPSLQLEKFPGPVQTLFLKQVNEAREWYNQGDPLYKRIRIPGWRNEASVEADPELDRQLEIYRDLGNRGNSGEHGESASIPSGQDILADLPRSNAVGIELGNSHVPTFGTTIWSLGLFCMPISLNWQKYGQQIATRFTKRSKGHSREPSMRLSAFLYARGLIGGREWKF